MKYRLQDLIDVEQFQALQDRLNEIYSFPSAIIDNDGNILTATAWQDVCVKFHRQNMECEKECVKSDQYILSHINEAKPAVSYRCPHGLVDNATPIIIDGEHVGNFFTGQFFLEEPDLEFFRTQARRYGFDEEAYLEAVRKVPIWSQEQLNSYLFFIKGLIEVISGIGLKNLKAVEAREKAEESEQQFQAMFETVSIGMAQADPCTGRWVRVNQKMCGITGYTVDELLALCVPDITHPEDRARDWELFQRVVRGDAPDYRLEKRYIRKDGAVVWVNVNMTVIRDAAGRPVRTMAAIEDITERKRAEEALRFQAMVLDQIQDHVTVTDMEGRITYVNEAECRSLKHSREDLIGRSVEDFGDDPSRGASQQEIIEQTLASGGWRGEVVNVASDGNELVMDCRTRVIRDERGQAVAMCGIATDITERKRAEEALRDSAQRLQNLADNLPNAMVYQITAEPDGGRRFTYVSRGVERLNEVTVEEVLADAGIIYRQMLPEDLAAVKGLEEEALRTLTPLRVEVESRLPSGRLRSFEYTSTPRYLADGRLVWDGVELDITERKRAEEALRESEAQKKAILNGITTNIALVDKELKILWANKAAAGSVNRHPEDMVGHPCYAFWGDPDKPCTNCPTVKAIETRRSEHMIVQTPDGRIWDEAGEPIFGMEGNVVAVVEIAQDITDRKRAEEAVQRSEQKYRELVENANSIILRMDMLGNITFFNEFAERFFGYSESEILGKSAVGTIVPETDSVGKDLREMVLNLVQTPEKYIANENENMCKDGQRVWISWSNKPVVDDTGKVVEILCIGNDISERKRAEEERANLEAQLQQAQKMEAVGRLAGGVAHDFNNALQVIIGHTALAMDQVDPSSQLHDDLAEIEKAANRSVALTGQLLAFARKQTVAPKVLDLNKTVEGMLKMLQRLIGEDIGLRWHPADDLWAVRVDPSQIDQILANLCVNARDAIADVGKITIETGNRTLNEEYCADHVGFAPGEYVVLAVSDDGCGMNKETLSHAFEPFFTTKEVGQGTGLGLATVYGIVKQNNGFINVYSEPGSGTTFTIYLPRHRGGVEGARKEGALEPAVRGHETVLLVEDEAGILKLTSRMLRGQGYNVLTANGPDEAIRLAGQYAEEIHLLMTDVVMPEMNGRDLANELLLLHPKIKCLFMSGYTANVIAHHGVLDEGVHFIQKPFLASVLAIKVREVLEQPRKS